MCQVANTLSYSVDVAKIFGVVSASFISFLYSLSSVSDDIVLDRKTLYMSTGIEEEKQVEVETSLSDCGVISVKGFKGFSDKNHYILNKERVADIMVSGEGILTSMPIKYEKPKKKTLPKRQRTIVTIKTSIKMPNPLHQQYACDWVDSIFARGGCTSQAFKIALGELVEFADGDDDKLTELLKIAVKSGWRESLYVINKYKEFNKSQCGNNFSDYSKIKSDGSDIIDEVF